MSLWLRLVTLCLTWSIMIPIVSAYSSAGPIFVDFVTHHPNFVPLAPAGHILIKQFFFVLPAPVRHILFHWVNPDLTFVPPGTS
jgi:hypothetical protein